MTNHLRLPALACALAIGVGATWQRNPTSRPIWLDRRGATIEAELVGDGSVSTAGNEFGGAVTPNGREMYFTRSVPRSYMYVILVSRFVNGRWRAPEVASFSGSGRDFDPVITPDGKRLYFISDRGSGGQRSRSYDLWMAERDGDEWGEPVRVDAPISLESSDRLTHEWFASATRDGTLYFSAVREDSPGGAADIYRSRFVEGRFAEPEKLDSTINTPGWESEPYIAPDESFLLFSALDRRDGFGGWDIYISYRDGAGWTAPRNLGPLVNTATRDYSSRLAPDSHTLYFTSERHFRMSDASGPPPRVDYKSLVRGARGIYNGGGNIYRIDLRNLPVFRTQ
ncbi:MAG TPA: hypothetical protein VJ672_07260 [Gemmatimonadaceae bacterium]|nr:hypothetical protein [Gemmatimonadaceae bacterium]